MSKKLHARSDHLLLAETNNAGALSWLKNNDEVGMLTAIKNVVDMLVKLPRTTQVIEPLVQANFVRLTANDPWFREF